jgi:hypothetical protein
MSQFSSKSVLKITGFLKISLALHTRLAAVTHRAVGEFLHVAVNREEFLTLREGTRIPVVSKRDGHHFKREYAEIKNNASTKE